MSYFQDLRVFRSRKPWGRSQKELRACSLSVFCRRLTPWNHGIANIFFLKPVTWVVYPWGWGLSLYMNWVRYKKWVQCKKCVRYKKRVRYKKCVRYTRSGYGILEVSVPYNFKWAKIRTMKGTDRLCKVAELSM